MALKKSEKRLLGLLGVVIVIFLVDRFVIGSGDDEAPVEATGARIAQASRLVQAAVTKKETPATANQNAYYASWGRNPFSVSRSAAASAAASEQRGSSPKLNGIFWKQGKAFVLINDSVLGEGEENKGIRIERIEGTEVLCRQGGRSFTLHWRESP